VIPFGDICEGLPITGRVPLSHPKLMPTHTPSFYHPNFVLEDEARFSNGQA